jgi:hypothetical protein
MVECLASKCEVQRSNPITATKKQAKEKQTWRPMDRIEDMNPHNSTHLVFDKGTQNTWWRKTASLTNVAEKTGYLISMQKTEARSISLTLYKYQFKMQ